MYKLINTSHSPSPASILKKRNPVNCEGKDNPAHNLLSFRGETIYNFIIKRVFSPYRRSISVGRKLQGDSSIDFIQHFLLLRREYI
jgi:hypothetical protein